MDKRIFVGPPDEVARQELFKLFFSDRPTDVIDYEKLASLTENYVSADIEYIATESAREAVARNLDAIDQSTVEQVIGVTQPSISEEELDLYEGFRKLQRW